MAIFLEGTIPARRCLPFLVSEKPRRRSHRADSSRREESANRDVFVHIFPVNPYAPADKPPVGALLGRGTKKSRKPRQWRRNTPTVHERDNQFVVGALNIDSVLHEACASAGAGGLMP